MAERAVSGRAVYLLGVAHKLRRYWARPPAGEARIGHLRTLFYRDVWDEAARAVGGSVSQVEGSLFDVRYPGGRLRVQKNVTSLDDPVTTTIAMDKPLVLRLLAARGIPVPRHASSRFDDVAVATKFLQSVGGHCVVKPARLGIGGLGVTTSVDGLAQLYAALGYARIFDPWVMLEELVEGGVYRLLYLDGELLDAVLRLPPSVTGDGMATIDRLVEAENQRRLRLGIEAAQTLVNWDRELRGTLREQGYRLRSVPEAGAVVRLKRVVNENCRTDNRAAAGDVCPELVAVGAEAAATVGLRLAGVDVITPDPSKPLAEVGGAVIEVNSSPGLYYHYMKAEPGVPVATMILERLAAHPERAAGGRQRALS